MTISCPAGVGAMAAVRDKVGAMARTSAHIYAIIITTHTDTQTHNTQLHHVAVTDATVHQPIMDYR